MISGALVHTCQFDRKSLDKCKPWMEVVQRVLFVLNPAWSRTFPHIADPAKWCKGFFLHSSYLFCALSFESLLCRCFQFKSLCAKSQLGMFWLLAELLSVFDSFFFFCFSWITPFEAVVEFCNWWTTGECVSAPAS